MMKIWSRRKLKSKKLKIIKFEGELWSLNLKAEEIMVEEMKVDKFKEIQQ